MTGTLVFVMPERGHVLGRHIGSDTTAFTGTPVLTLIIFHESHSRWPQGSGTVDLGALRFCAARNPANVAGPARRAP